MIQQLNIEHLFSDIGAWSMHIGRISFWVLLAITFLLLFLRASLMRLFPARLKLSAIGQLSMRKINLIILISMLGFAGATFYAFKPDNEFLIYLAEKALDRQDYEEASIDYEPIARWGTSRADVYNNLAVSYLHLQKFPEAIEAFQRAQALAPNISAQSYILCANAYAQIGQPAQAAAQLNRALSIAQSNEQRNAIKAQLENLRQAFPGVAR